MASADFTHPAWLAELEANLVPTDEGTFEFDGLRFVLGTEISCVYRQGGRGRRLHLLLLLSSFRRGVPLQRRSRGTGMQVGGRRPAVGAAVGARPDFLGPGYRPESYSRSGPHLDAVVRDAGVEIRVRQHRGVFRRNGLSSPRSRDGTFQRSGNELGGARYRQPDHRILFRRPFPTQPGPRGHSLSGPAHLPGLERRLGEQQHLLHRRVLPGRREVLLRRPSQLRREPIARGDPGTRRPLPGVWAAHDPGGAEPCTVSSKRRAGLHAGISSGTRTGRRRLGPVS